MLKKCDEIFGFMPVDLTGIKPPACGALFLICASSSIHLRSR
jgi:hypothetical protein